MPRVPIAPYLAQSLAPQGARPERLRNERDTQIGVTQIKGKGAAPMKMPRRKAGAEFIIAGLNMRNASKMDGWDSTANRR